MSRTAAGFESSNAGVPSARRLPRVRALIAILALCALAAPIGAAALVPAGASDANRGRYVSSAREYRAAAAKSAAKSGASVAEMTATIQNALRSAIDEDARSRGLVFGPDEWKVLALDIELNAQGIAFVADKLRTK